MRVALLFPGQGAQYVGMGREIFEKYERAREVFLKASEVLNFDVARICFEGPEEELTSTHICQPAILTVSLACLEALKVECPQVKPEAVAGLSLGEFTALTVAGGMGFEDVLRVVKARGQYMQEACLERSGAMASIFGLEYSALSKICEDVGRQSVVAIANVNSPGQIVVSGENEGVRKVIDQAKSLGARRAIELQVSGAFHSPLMDSARLKLKEFLNGCEIQTPRIVFISNVLGQAVQDPIEIGRLLVEQVTHPVLWEQGIRELIRKGFDSFIEVGCGKVLSGLQRKIAPESRIFNVEDVKSLEEASNFLKGGS